MSSPFGFSLLPVDAASWTDRSSSLSLSDEGTEKTRDRRLMNATEASDASDSESFSESSGTQYVVLGFCGTVEASLTAGTGRLSQGQYSRDNPRNDYERIIAPVIDYFERLGMKCDYLFWVSAVFGV